MHGHGTSGFPSAPTGFQSGPPAWQPAPPKGQSRGLTYVALAIAVIATVLAVVGWFRPTPPPPPAHPSAPTYTEQQVADAKAAICDAFSTVKDEVASNTNRPIPASSDEIGTIAIGTNGRLALYAGGDYLLDQLAAQPAAPEELTQSIRSLAHSYKKIAISALDNQSNSALDPLRHDIDAEITRIGGMCTR